MVFLGDAGIVCGRRFLCSRFRFAERAPEAAHYERAFADAGLEVVIMPEGAVLEGLGDVAVGGERTILGYGPRSDAAGFAALSAFAPFLRVVAEVELPDPRFYHLATAVVFLDPDTVMYAPQGLTPAGVAAIRAAVPRTLAVGDRDVFEHQACNCIVRGDKILIDGCSHELRESLARLGFSVELFPSSEFKKGGGSVRCLLLPEIGPAEPSR
jgi:N-dimethylarginine dimethylaminohydrolase